MKLKVQNILVFGAITISLTIFLGDMSRTTPVQSIEIEKTQNYFLGGDYDADLEAGKIERGLVRERLNRSHVLLSHKELPPTLIQ